MAAFDMESMLIEAMMAHNADGEEVYSRGGCRVDITPLESYGAYAIGVLRGNNWIYNKETTPFQIMTMAGEEERKEDKSYSPEDYRLATALIAELKAEYPAEKINDLQGFEYSFAVALHCAMNRKTRIFIGGFCNRVRKMMLEGRNPGERVAPPYESSEWVGTVGERAVFTATIEKLIPYENDFGGGMLFIFNANGNRMLWFGSGTPDMAMRTEKDADGYDIFVSTVGDTVTFKATVKSHGNGRRDGFKETILSRVKEEKAKKKGK